MEKDTAISELQRVAKLLDSRSVSRSTFDDRGTISSAAIEAPFGSWNEAIVAAGFTPLPQGGLPKSETRRQERLKKLASSIPVASDEELLDDLYRVATLIGRRPSGNQIAAKGKSGRDVYQKRWGSIGEAYETAMARRK